MQDDQAANMLLNLGTPADTSCVSLFEHPMSVTALNCGDTRLQNHSNVYFFKLNNRMLSIGIQGLQFYPVDRLNVKTYRGRPIQGFYPVTKNDVGHLCIFKFDDHPRSKPEIVIFRHDLFASFVHLIGVPSSLPSSPATVAKVRTAEAGEATTDTVWCRRRPEFECICGWEGKLKSGSLIRKHTSSANRLLFLNNPEVSLKCATCNFSGAHLSVLEKFKEQIAVYSANKCDCPSCSVHNFVTYICLLLDEGEFLQQLTDIKTVLKKKDCAICKKGFHPWCDSNLHLARDSHRFVCHNCIAVRYKEERQRVKQGQNFAWFV